MIAEMSFYWIGIVCWLMAFGIEVDLNEADKGNWVMVFFTLMNAGLGLASVIVDYMYIPRMRIWYKKKIIFGATGKTRPDPSVLKKREPIYVPVNRKETKPDDFKNVIPWETRIEFAPREE